MVVETRHPGESQVVRCVDENALREHMFSHMRRREAEELELEPFLHPTVRPDRFEERARLVAYSVELTTLCALVVKLHTYDLSVAHLTDNMSCVIGVVEGTVL
jgi:hypothetical protein